MTYWLRILVVSFAGCLLLAPGSVSADTVSSSVGSSSVLGGPPVVSGGGLLLGGEQAVAAQEAVRASPEAVAERAASRTRFAGLGGAGAVALAKGTFGIESLSWVQPSSLGEERVTEYVGSNSAAEVSKSGQHLLVASSVPLRSRIGSGQLAPTSFALREEGDHFVAANPITPVSISKDPSDGVSLPGGIVVAPLESGAPEPSVTVGNQVVYPGTATDTDFMVQPSPGGVRASWQLLSEDSPQDNGLVFRLPAGAVLQLSKEPAGGAEIVEEGERTVFIPPAAATEADGSSLPVSYSVSGDVLTTHVDLQGSVAFPVMVDPTVTIVVGEYGTFGGSGVWPGWKYSANCEVECFKSAESPSYLLSAIWGPNNWPIGDYGQWYIYAPGSGKAGASQITRVDMQGLTHESLESYMGAAITGGSASNPVYTFNGTNPSETKPGNYFSGTTFAGLGMALCAYGQGGYDGGPKELCDPTHGGEVFDILDQIESAPQSNYNYAIVEGVAVTYIDQTPPNQIYLHGIPSSNKWSQYGPSTTYISGHDEGTGVASFSVNIPPPADPTKEHVFFAEKRSCSETVAFAGCPESASSGNVSFSEVPTGMWELGVYAYDATGQYRVEEIGPGGEEDQGTHVYPKLYIDHTAPKLTLGGALAEANGTIIGSGSYALTFGAEDGSTSEPQSGVRSLTVLVDGSKVDEVTTGCSEPAGVPYSLCFGLNGGWSMEGQKYGAGPHTITVVAKDWIGNEASSSVQVTVNEGTYQADGPGTVNLHTGDFKLSSTDVSVAAANATLTVGRTSDSRFPTQGSTGPLGPQWTLSLPDNMANGVWRSLQVMPNGNVQVTTTANALVTFVPNGSGGFTAPAGYQTITLTKQSSSPLEYKITDSAGNATTFTRPAGGEGEPVLLMPSSIVQATAAGGLNQVTYKFAQTSGTVEPTEVIAPYPTTLKCSVEIVKGCRVLEFKYASSITATGERESRWGQYPGRLKEVVFKGWNPNSKEMQSKTIAQYEYDHQGRLRAEWNPQMSPALRTKYGYDPGGHVTALTLPGQETWTFTYGTTENDPNTGRLIKSEQAPTSEPLWNGEEPESAETPVTTGSPTVGGRLAVSNGKWINSPVSYSYTWEDCNLAGSECKIIQGADDPNYSPTLSDDGHKLVAVVGATNGDGTVTAASANTTEVNPFGKNIEYSSPTGSEPTDIAKGPSSDLWFTDYGTSKIGKTTTSGEITEYPLPTGSHPTGIVEGPDGHEWFTNNGTKKIGKITSSGEITEYGLPAGAVPCRISNGPESDLWVTDCGTGAIVKMTTSGAATSFKRPGGSIPSGIAEGPESKVWFTNTNPSHSPALDSVGWMTAIGGSHESTLPSGSGPREITRGPDGNMWFTDYSSGKIGKITTTPPEPITEYSLPAGSKPCGLTSGPYKALWFTLCGTNRLGMITTTGTIIEFALPAGSNPSGTTEGSDGKIWFTETGINKIGKTGIISSEGALQNPQPGATIDYGIPLSGTGLPTMTSSEVGKWAESDIPREATALFPADEPQGWPASDYHRATIYYFDGSEHTVNVATPSGGIVTAEYDSHGNTKRTLSADNRAAAIGSGSKSVEVAEHLSTANHYNLAGTQLEETLGPEHAVKLPNGSEVQARKQVKYAYEVGAPSGGPYELVTKTVEDALTSGKEEDKRTIEESYSGQENLGWKLHKPTTTTVGPAGLNLVHETSYSASTGQVTETQMPAGVTGSLGAPAYSSSFGSIGSGNGQVTNPSDVATDSHGNVWVTDTSNNRIEEFDREGSFIRTVGSAGTGNGQFKSPEGIAVDSQNNVWVADTHNNRIEEFTSEGSFIRTFGSNGPGNGQVSNPEGIAVDPNGDVWVADTSNNRIEEFTSEGKFVGTIGSHGKGEGQLQSPRGVAIDGEGHVWVADTGNNRIEEFSGAGSYIRQSGTTGSGNGQFSMPRHLAIGPEENIWVTDMSNHRVEVFTPTGSYKEQFGSSGSGSGQFGRPVGISLHNATVVVVDQTNSRIENWVRSPSGGSPSAHDSQVVYYTPGTEASVATCQNHPEWANLTCQTQPAHQPEVSGMPELSVTTFTYNIWDEPETTKSTNGGSTRTETDTYDPLGRLEAKETTSTTGTSVPQVKYQYSSETGLPIKQSTGSGSEEKKITTEYNKLGQATQYTDAGGATTTFEYEKENDERLTKTTDPKGSQTIKYDETTGAVKELTDSAAGTFTASYDIEGNLETEGLPNGMTARTKRNSNGEPTSLEYTKTTHCTESCTWFSDSVVPSIHGQWMTQTSTLSTNNYAYNEAGWLTQVQDTPTGKGCATRLYQLDTDGNRTSTIFRPPGVGGACATTGGEVERHTYDTADRLIDPGMKYNPFGDITTLPAVDAGGWELASSYYTDGQLQSQTQNGQTVGYNLDPARRTNETISTGKMTADVTDHYDGAGAAPAWTSYVSGEWTRNISGISSGLAAIQQDTETPVLQIANLHGDIVATVPDSETATKLSSAFDTTEYGVPTSSEPAKYSWLGAGDFPTELSSGVIAMGARSYIPQLGRFLQPDPQPGGSANAYAYTHGNPLNESDPSGEWTLEATSGGVGAISQGEGVQLEGGTGIAAGAIIPPPVNIQEEEAFWADPPWDQVTAGYEEYEEWEEEGEEYEYISDRQDSHSGKEESLTEPALLFQPLTTAEGSEGATTTSGSTVPLCKAGSEGPCARDTGGMRGHCMGSATPHCHGYHGARNVHGGSVCYGIAAVTTLAGPELSIPRWIGYAVFGYCGG